MKTQFAYGDEEPTFAKVLEDANGRKVYRNGTGWSLAQSTRVIQWPAILPAYFPMTLLEAEPLDPEKIKKGDKLEVSYTTGDLEVVLTGVAHTSTFGGWRTKQSRILTDSPTAWGNDRRDVTIKLLERIDPIAKRREEVAQEKLGQSYAHTTAGAKSLINTIVEHEKARGLI